MRDTDQSTFTPDASRPVNDLTTKYWQYVQENPIKALSAATLVWGSLLLLMFFLRIGYMPDVNFDSVSSVLYAVSLLGLFITAYTMLMMVTPGLLLAYAKKPMDNISWQHILCISTGAALIWAVVLCSFFSVFSFLTVTVAWTFSIAVALLAPWLGLLFSKKWPVKTKYSIETLKTKNSHCNPQYNPTRVYFWSLSMLCGMVLLLTISLLFIGFIGMDGDIRTASNGAVTEQLALLIFLIALSAGLIGSARPSETHKIALVLAPMLLFVVLSTTGSFSSIPTMAIRILGQVLRLSPTKIQGDEESRVRSG